MSGSSDADFAQRREKAKSEINQIDADVIHNNPERETFFETVYQNAGGDAAAVPWADLAAKDRLDQWLSDNSQHCGNAIDIGCGLGDNAEALRDAGYHTTAFDFSPAAIEWAMKRFPDSSVDYTVADLFSLPPEWIGAFDLVNECYTLQSIPAETLNKSIPAIASLVSVGGFLLVYTRIRPDGTEVEGPPWPLETSRALSFSNYGLECVCDEDFELLRPDRSIAHKFTVWRRPK